MHGISQSTLQSTMKPDTAGSNPLSVGVLTLATEIQAEEFSVKPRKDFQRSPQHSFGGNPGGPHLSKRSREVRNVSSARKTLASYRSNL
jgi:hypothetical protein